MEKKLRKILGRYKEVEELLADPDVLADRQRYLQLSKEHSELQQICRTYDSYKKVVREIEEMEKISESSEDSELAELAGSELGDLREERDRLRDELLTLLTPRDPDQEKNAIVEIRAGTGGNEASLFASDLFRMYSKYVEKRGWKKELISAHPTEIGGFKEAVFFVEGRGAYRSLKFESGVHRVQRVPVTESGGRIHTSTVTVAVLPEVKEIEVEIDPRELNMETFRASGHGGQHVNKVSTAVRITHIPTGIVATSQSERSQHQNRVAALKVLRARLLDRIRSEQEGRVKERRRSLIGSGERSEKIRTYNFPQRRVTDHRMNLTLHRLEDVLNGDLDELIEGLLAAERTERLKEA